MASLFCNTIALNLADANGNVAASYSSDEFGVALSSSESFPSGWSNPYRYDGRDLVRYDTETALDWMSVRAYDPTLGRFIARDPLGRAPLMGWTSQPYAYAGNNPLVNVDPSGQRLVGADGAVTSTPAQQRAAYSTYHRTQARYYRTHPKSAWLWTYNGCSRRSCDAVQGHAKDMANDAVRAFGVISNDLSRTALIFGFLGGISETIPLVGTYLGIALGGASFAAAMESNFASYVQVQFSWNEGWNDSRHWDSNADLEQIRSSIDRRFEMFEYMSFKKALQAVVAVIAHMPNLPGWAPGSALIREIKQDGRQLSAIADNMPRESYKQPADDYVSQEEQWLSHFE